METELVTVENQQVVTSSRNVADHFEKRHADVIEAIENLKANLTENSVNKFFIKTTYEIRGKEYPEYIMNRDGFALLVMDKGREYGEEKPYSRNGHTGYAIAWNEKVLKLIEKG